MRPGKNDDNEVDDDDEGGDEDYDEDDASIAANLQLLHIAAKW